MGSPEILYADRGLAVASVDNVLVTVLDEASTMPRLRALRKHVERFRMDWPGANCGLTVLGPGALQTVPPEIRKESEAITRENPSPGSALVVEGTGFAASATRAFLTGLFLVSRARSKIYGSVADAAAYVAPIARDLAKNQLRPGDLEAAVEAVRAAMAAAPSGSP